MVELWVIDEWGEKKGQGQISKIVDEQSRDGYGWNDDVMKQ